MLNIQIELTTKLNEIVNDIIAISSDKNLAVRYANDTELPSYVLGRCNIDFNTEAITVLVRKNETSEYVISHELLHALYLRKGFLFQMTDVDVSEYIEIISSRLDDILIHKYIYIEQKKRGFNINSEINRYINSLLDVKKESGIIEKDIFTIMDIIEIEYCFPEFRPVHIKHFKKNHKLSFGISQRILTLYNSIDSTTPFTLRNTLIKAFKEFESIVIETGEKPLNLQTNVAIPPIFRTQQLKQLASSIFTFKENSIKINGTSYLSTLHGQDDGQCCSIIDSFYNSTIKRSLEVLLLDEFLHENGVIYRLRD